MQNSLNDCKSIHTWAIQCNHSCFNLDRSSSRKTISSLRRLHLILHTSHKVKVDCRRKYSPSSVWCWVHAWHRRGERQYYADITQRSRRTQWRVIVVVVETKVGTLIVTAPEWCQLQRNTLKAGLTLYLKIHLDYLHQKLTKHVHKAERSSSLLGGTLRHQ